MFNALIPDASETAVMLAIANGHADNPLVWSASRRVCYRLPQKLSAGGGEVDCVLPGIGEEAFFFDSSLLDFEIFMGDDDDVADTKRRLNDLAGKDRFAVVEYHNILFHGDGNKEQLRYAIDNCVKHRTNFSRALADLALNATVRAADDHSGFNTNGGCGSAPSQGVADFLSTLRELRGLHRVPFDGNNSREVHGS